MGYKALLTLDLKLENEDSSWKRQKIHDYLEGEDWIKVESLPWVWKCSFGDDIDRNSAIEICKRDVFKATKIARVHSYNAAVQVGTGEVEEF